MLLDATSIISEKTSKICLIRNWQQTSKQTYACCNLCALIVGILRLKASKSTPVSASAFRSAKMAKIFRLLLFWVTRGSVFIFRQAAVRSFLASGSIFPPGASTNHMWASRHLDIPPAALVVFIVLYRALRIGTLTLLPRRDECRSMQPATVNGACKCIAYSKARDLYRNWSFLTIFLLLSVCLVKTWCTQIQPKPVKQNPLCQIVKSII